MSAATDAKATTPAPAAAAAATDAKATATAAAAPATAATAATASKEVVQSVSTPAVSRPWETMPFTTKDEARAVMTKIQAEIFKLFDVDKDGYLTEKDYTAMDNTLSDGAGDAKRSAETFKKMCEVMGVKTAGKITPIEYIRFKLRELDTKQFKIEHLKQAAMTFVQQLVELQHKLNVHDNCPVDANGKCNYEAIRAAQLAQMQQMQAQGGHGHSHGGKPCHGHGGGGGHNHSHGGGHNHSHAGGHNHSHAGGHNHSHGGEDDDHGHSHAGGHNHSHGAAGAQQHGHSHGGKPCHGHGANK